MKGGVLGGQGCPGRKVCQKNFKVKNQSYESREDLAKDVLWKDQLEVVRALMEAAAMETAAKIMETSADGEQTLAGTEAFEPDVWGSSSY